MMHIIQQYSCIIRFLVLGLIITNAYVAVTTRPGFFPTNSLHLISRPTSITTTVFTSFCPTRRKPSILNTNLFGSIKENNDMTISTSSSPPTTVAIKKGFGAPPPPPTAEELEARGKRSAQKQKYREQIKMAKTMPTLKKIVKSGVDDKVTTNSKVKGCGGAA